MNHRSSGSLGKREIPVSSSLSERLLDSLSAGRILGRDGPGSAGLDCDSKELGHDVSVFSSGSPRREPDRWKIVKLHDEAGRSGAFAPELPLPGCE